VVLGVGVGVLAFAAVAVAGVACLAMIASMWGVEIGGIAW
jgi:hypothetical protein